MDPMLFLRTTDPLERMAMWTIARAAREIRTVEQRNLAVYIHEAIGKLLGAK